MKKIILFLLIISLVGCSSVPPLEEPQTNETTEPSSTTPVRHLADSQPLLLSKDYYDYAADHPTSEELLQSINQFARESGVQLLSGEANDNYSPISLYMALAMVATGAKGETAEEIYQLLGRGVDPEALAQEMQQLNQLLNVKTEGGRIKLANSIWSQQDLPFEPTFIKRLNDKFAAALFEVDFSLPETAEEMSNWVSDMTEGLIKPEFTDLENMISVLINTLYFKEGWVYPFEEANTKPDIFHGINGDIEKDFLQQRKEFEYIDHDGIEGVILPFELSRMIILKKSGTNPKTLLEDYSLEELTKFKQRATVNLSLPKFKFDNSYDLIDTLKSLGIHQAFDLGLADFSAMTPTGSAISQVRQDSFIALDETGVEAAAMTMIGNERAMILEDPPIVDLSFDEPFLFIIESRDSVPLFIGTLTN